MKNGVASCVSHIFNLFHALPVFFVKYCIKIKYCAKANGGSMKACQLPFVWKPMKIEFFYYLCTLTLYRIKL